MEPGPQSLLPRKVGHPSQPITPRESSPTPPGPFWPHAGAHWRCRGEGVCLPSSALQTPYLLPSRQPQPHVVRECPPELKGWMWGYRGERAEGGSGKRSRRATDTTCRRAFTLRGVAFVLGGARAPWAGDLAPWQQPCWGSVARLGPLGHPNLPHRCGMAHLPIWSSRGRGREAWSGCRSVPGAGKHPAGRWKHLGARLGGRAPPHPAAHIDPVTIAASLEHPVGPGGAAPVRVQRGAEGTGTAPTCPRDDKGG